VTQQAWRTCTVCGYSANEPAVQPRVALCDDGTGKGVFMDIVQCRRIDECRARCDAAGRPWPLISPPQPKPTGVRR